MADSIIHRLLNTKEAAERLGLAPHTLSVARCEKSLDLPYVKLGGAVRYRTEDLEAFILRRLVMPE